MPHGSGLEQRKSAPAFFWIHTELNCCIKTLVSYRPFLGENLELDGVTGPSREFGADG